MEPTITFNTYLYERTSVLTPFLFIVATKQGDRTIQSFLTFNNKSTFKKEKEQLVDFFMKGTGGIKEEEEQDLIQNHIMFLMHLDFNRVAEQAQFGYDPIEEEDLLLKDWNSYEVKE